jgi:hypothetical protein
MTSLGLDDYLGQGDHPMNRREIKPGSRYLLGVPGGKRDNNGEILGSVLVTGKDVDDTFDDQRGISRKGIRAVVVSGSDDDPEFLHLPTSGNFAAGRLFSVGEELLLPARYFVGPAPEPSFDPQDRALVRLENYQASKRAAIDLLARARGYGIEGELRDMPWEFFAEGPDPMMLLEIEDLDLERILQLLDRQRGLYFREAELRRVAMNRR